MSQLAAHPELRLGFSNEFLERARRLARLARALPAAHENVRGLNHDLAYRALADGAIDVTDLYSTDAEIVQYDLLALADDAHYFPRLRRAVRLPRRRRSPRVRELLDRLAGRIDAVQMTRMNARAKLERDAGDADRRRLPARSSSASIRIRSERSRGAAHLAAHARAPGAGRDLARRRDPARDPARRARVLPARHRSSRASRSPTCCRRCRRWRCWCS